MCGTGRTRMDPEPCVSKERDLVGRKDTRDPTETK